MNFLICILMDVQFWSRCHLVLANLAEISFTFSTPQLKHLVIDRLNEGSDTPYMYRILISAPNLISFQCCDFTSHQYCFENIPSLEVASLNMIVEEKYNEEWDIVCSSLYKNRCQVYDQISQRAFTLTLNHHFLLLLQEL
ncbi:hypothetical protein AQUCO_06600030v1 [Aquilegia coerulea]|uniref:Uncharacterized protein n=1 Tax=Aquilegia coerulea TaxID=218851 RepID=A0A2G5CC37_AQUCA|nr:hypothetical protein AQUCO_06600030v1 [Aquilegia coerulea]